jgi:hypothetical protein
MKKFLLVFVVAGLTLAGCGGSSAKDTDSGSGNGDGNGAFGALLDKSSSATLRVTYRNEDGKEWTVSQDGPDKTAYINDDTHIIKVDGTTTVCSNIDTEPECQDMTGALGQAAISSFTGLFAFAQTYIEAAKQAKSFGDMSSETIAGRSAECVTITPSTIGGLAGNLAEKFAGDKADQGWKACVDKDTGVMLLLATVGTDDANADKVEAIEVGEPQASDFEPPANATTPGDSTTDNSTDTSTDDSTTETSAPDDENCTRLTLPSGITMPSGITLPCE